MQTDSRDWPCSTLDRAALTQAIFDFLCVHEDGVATLLDTMDAIPPTRTLEQYRTIRALSPFNVE